MVLLETSVSAQTPVATLQLASGVFCMESLSAEMIEWFDQFLAAFQSLRSLESDDPRFYDAFEGLVVSHRVWCGHNGSLHLFISPKHLKANGHEIPLKQATKAMAWFHDRCRKRALEEIMFLGMLSPHDFQVFMTLLLQDRSLFADADFPANFLLAEQVSLIQVNPPNVEDSFFGAAPFQIDTLDLSKIEQENRPSPIQQMAIQDIMANDRPELESQIMGWLQEGRIDAIHRCIGRLRAGLENQYQEVQVRGYVGLRIVVQTLVAKQQTLILYQVFKALPKTVSAKAPADLLAFHLDTFSEVMAYFHRHEKVRPLVYGFEWLANWRFHSKQPLSNLAKDVLEQHFDPDVIAKIVTLQTEDPALADHWQKLLARYPRALAKPLLFYLYDSEEKTLRELLLGVLQGVMPHIGGDVVREVHRAMERRAPWYIKRNLLTLLADQPPESLTPLLVRMAVEETQPQLLDTVYACAFRLKAVKIHRLCEQALEQAKDDEALVALIRHIGTAANAYYLPHLKRFVHKKRSDVVIRAALEAIAQIATPESVQFLERILSGGGLFSKRSDTRLRRLAAEALSYSQ